MFWCPSLMLGDNDNSKGRAEVAIRQPRRTAHALFISIFACPLVVCVHAAEEIRRTAQERKVYFNPDLINRQQGEG